MFEPLDSQQLDLMERHLAEIRDEAITTNHLLQQILEHLQKPKRDKRSMMPELY